MISIEALIKDVCETLGASDKTSGITFLPEFPARKQDLPLKYPVVSVGVDRVGANQTVASGESESVSSPCTVRLKLLICVPKTNSGSSCHQVFDKVISACPLLLGKYEIQRFYTGAIKYSTVIAGLVLPLNIVFSAGEAFPA